MSYRNKTYVIFDGDFDSWAYRYMKGWIKNEHMEFNFYDAHSILPLTNRANEKHVKTTLRQRLANTKQAVVLVGDHTRHLYRYVRWEIETCLNLDIPIVVVNLNGMRELDKSKCPALLRGTCSMHIPFKARALMEALDTFCPNYKKHKAQGETDLTLPAKFYKDHRL